MILLLSILYICAIIYVLKLTKYVNIDILKPSVISIFLLFWFVVDYVGYILLFYDLTKYTHEFHHKYLIYEMFLLNLLAITLVIISYAIVDRYLVLKVKGKEYYKINNMEYNFAILFLMIGIFFLLVFFSKLDTIAIVGLVTGVGDAAHLRSNATSGFSGSRSFYYGFINGLLPFLSYYFFAVYLKIKTFKTKLFWYISLLFAIICTVQSLSKAPVVFYLFSLWVLYLVINSKRFNLKILFIGGIISFLAILLIYGFIGGFSNKDFINDILLPMLNRAFGGQIRPLYYYLEMFPNHHDWLLGQSIGIPSFLHKLIYDSRYILPVEIMNYIHPGVYIDRVGRANTIFWGEAYANFSYIGIIFVSILTGFIMSITQYIVSKKKDFLHIALYTFFIMYFIKLVFSGFSTVLLPLSSSLIYIVLTSLFLFYVPKVRFK